MLAANGKYLIVMEDDITRELIKDKKAGSLILTLDEPRKDYFYAKVKSLGSECDSFIDGYDYVIALKRGIEFEVDGEKYIRIHENDILACYKQY